MQCNAGVRKTAQLHFRIHLATEGATLIGTPLAFCLVRVDVPGKTVLLTLATLPLVLPSFVAAYALVLLFGHAGVVTTGLRAIGIPIGPIYGLTGMDGARFANALVALGCSASEMTWRSGVDILSFGATKNGAMGADAIVVFNPELVEPLSYRLRRAGQTWSNMRFAAAQLIAYVEDDLFLRLASHANELASKLGRELAALPGVRLIARVEANLVFVAMPEPAIEALAAARVRFARRRGGVIRLVTRFDGTKDEVDQFITLVRQVIG
jgi:hypothetical protein